MPGRSLRPLDFPALRQVCGAVLDTPPPGVSPEGSRSLREAGVSGPCDRSLRPVEASATRLRPGAESPPCTGVSGPSGRSLRPSAKSARCGAPLVSVRRWPGGRPESPVQPRSIRPLRPESPALVTSNSQKSWRGINTPPPTSGQLARPAFMNPNSQELKFARSLNSSVQTR